MHFDQLLKVAVHGGASDIILKTNTIPRFRHQGKLITLSDGRAVPSETMEKWVKKILPKHMEKILMEHGDADFGYQSPFGSRFRVNLFRQRQQFGMVLRVISSHVQTMEELQLPSILGKFALKKRGLVLVTGATSSGKSTTLAAMIQKINQERSGHIITIEDPIEISFKDEKATINQREVGIDVSSFASALKAALRQTPDVILVGELRDKETIETALMAAETGHLVMSTLHTNDAVDALTRLMSYFSAHQHTAIKNQLAGTLNAVISQRLVRKADSKGMVPAIEIMVVNSYIRDCILTNESFDPIYKAIEKGRESYGMQTFDQSLLQLYHKGIITQKEALLQATSKENMRLLMSGVNAS